MIRWVMNKNIYGMPDYQMSATTSRGFTQTIGDVGHMLTIPYNPSGPTPITVTFGWRGGVLAGFRQQWENRNTLAFGANWFQMTLPVAFARGDRGDNLYDVHCTQPFAASLAGHDYWKVSLSLDVDTSPALVY